MRDGGTTDTTVAIALPRDSSGTRPATTLPGQSRAATVNVHAMPAGGNGGATDVGITASEIRLGNVSTLTGPVPGLFQGATVGAQAFVAYANSLGGMFGRSFKLDARDDQFDTGQNKSQTADLIAKTFALLGSFSLYDDAPVNELRAAGMPDLGTALNPARVELPTNFSPNPPVRGAALGPFNYFKQRFPDAVKAVGSVYVNIPSAVRLYQDYKKAAQSVGYVFKYDREFGATETDFTADVVRMRDSGVKMVYLLSVDDATTARFAKAMRAQNYKPQVYAINSSGYDPDVLTSAGSAAEGMFVPTASSLFGGEDSAVVPEVALLNKWVQKVKPGYKPDIYTAYAWASGRLMLDAMERVGPNLTRAALNDAIRKIGVSTANGLVAPANPGAKVPATCYVMARVVNGKYERYDSPPPGFRCDDGPFYSVAP